MLVVTRQKNEKVYIDHAGERIEVSIVDVRGDSVRVGFNGPRSFAVQRDDVVKQGKDGR